MVATAVIMKRGARWTGQILISMFHLLHMVHMPHMVHGFSKSIDFSRRLCQTVHPFSRNTIKVPTNERKKTTKNEIIAKSGPKVA